MRFPRPPFGTESLYAQATLQLLRGFAVAAVVIGLLVGWLFQLSQEKSAEQSIRDATDFHANQISDLEQRWEEEAIRYRSRLEFMRLFDEPAVRWVRLRSYLTTQGADQTFSALLVADRRQQVVFSNGFSQGAPYGRVDGFAEMGWFYDHRDQTLYRYYVQRLWLGPDGMGRLVLFRPMDHALLVQMAGLNTELFLRWDGAVVASSLGEYGKTIPLPEHTGPTGQDDSVEQGSLPWSGAAPRPELVIHRPVSRLFTSVDLLVAAIVGTAGFLAAHDGGRRRRARARRRGCRTFP